MIYHLTAFFTSGKFIRICCGYLRWEHIYSSRSRVWTFAIYKTSRQSAFAENNDDRWKFRSADALNYDRNFTMIRATIMTESVSMNLPVCGMPGTVD